LIEKVEPKTLPFARSYSEFIQIPRNLGNGIPKYPTSKSGRFSFLHPDWF